MTCFAVTLPVKILQSVTLQGFYAVVADKYVEFGIKDSHVVSIVDFN